MKIEIAQIRQQQMQHKIEKEKMIIHANLEKDRIQLD
jgi:hypothetical protein